MERWMGCAAVLVLAGIVLSGIFAPQLAPMNPFEPNMAIRLQGPTAAHLLGTDALGRDLLSRMLYGWSRRCWRSASGRLWACSRDISAGGRMPF